MRVLLAEPPDDREPRQPIVPPGSPTSDQLVVEPVLWTFGGQAHHRDSARQEPWS